MQCDLCTEQPAAVLISNTANGDTQAVCGMCLPGWCLGVVVQAYQDAGESPDATITAVINAMTEQATGVAAAVDLGTVGPAADASPTGGGTTGNEPDTGPAAHTKDGPGETPPMVAEPETAGARGPE